MTEFLYLTCNHEINPISVGKDVLLGWSYAESHERNLSQLSFELTVARDGDFSDVIFSSGTIDGDAVFYHLSSHIVLPEVSRFFWRVTSRISNGETVISKAGIFETGIYGLNYWSLKGCRWMTLRASKKNLPESAEFFRSFKLSKNKRPISARAYVFGSGFTVFKINGKAPDGRILAPANSVYGKRCYYETYDITNNISSGENTLSLICGAGYNEEYSQYGYRYFGKHGFIALVRIVYSDGTESYIASDGKWKCRETKITSCGIYKGETFDNSKSEFKSFPLISSDKDAPWMPEGKLVPREIPQIIITETVSPTASWKSGDGIVFDFGEVSTALARITVNAPRGTRIKLNHSEMINPDGSPDYYTNRSAKAEDVYICSGEENETYMPSLTYHCFRYLTVSGTEPKKIIRVEKCKLSSDVRSTGYFNSSDVTLNRIHKIMLTGIRNNLFSIPTDCPVRDERTPCAMDSQAIEKSVMYNFNTASYYTKWLGDISDVYEPGKGNTNPDWNGDIVSLMWRIYNFYGDIRPAEEYYDTAIGMFFYNLEKYPDGLCKNGFGDWCNPNQNNWETFFGSVESVNTSLFYGMSQKLYILGKLLGKSGDMLERLKAAGELIAKSFAEKNISDEGTVLGGRNTEQAMPLYENVISGKTREKVADTLISELEKSKSADIGIYGGMSLFEVLCDEEHAGLALDILHNPEYPGYGFLLAKGATSLWEQWRYKGRMDSHSHGMFAGPDAAFYKMFAGVSSLQPGFSEINIKPQLPSGLAMTEAEIISPHGKIRVKTEKLCGGYEIFLTVPLGCKAYITFPEAEGSEPYSFFDGELPCEYKEQMSLGSGIYHFRRIPERLQTDH